MADNQELTEETARGANTVWINFTTIMPQALKQPLRPISKQSEYHSLKNN